MGEREKRRKKIQGQVSRKQGVNIGKTIESKGSQEDRWRGRQEVGETFNLKGF